MKNFQPIVFIPKFANHKTVYLNIMIIKRLTDLMNNITIHKLKTLYLAAFLMASAGASAQHTVVKTNALYWTTTTPNLAIETKIGQKWTAEISAGYNPFTFSDNKKLRHFAVQPEARYWLCSPYAGHFVGMHLVYAHYNIGGIKLPLGLFKDLHHYRYQGDLGAIGFGYGYSWMLPGNHWSIEAEIGVGVGFTTYDKYECATCGSKVGSDTKTLVMPTKAAISLIYNLK